MHDLVAAAKAAPGKLNYGYGTSSGLICTELLKSVAGIDLAKVPYRSSAQALTDLISGQLDVICEPLVTSGPNAKAGRLRILALTGKTRSSLAPEIPTVAEVGVPGMSYTAWLGMYAPAGLPPEVATRLRAELLAIVQDPAFAEKVRAIGLDPHPGDAEALAELHRAEIKSVAATVKAADIKPE
jgi:tripartite-type tricarboxylate transporter receptor subunit TctC